MRSTLIGLSLALVVPWASCVAQQSTVPFVGCPADGQQGPVEAPKGEPRVPPLNDVPAEGLAFYKGEYAPGAYAPRGWHCRVWYGSSGGFILVTPEPIDTTDFLPPKTPGPALEIEQLYRRDIREVQCSQVRHATVPQTAGHFH
jgi:hypothetical protein